MKYSNRFLVIVILVKTEFLTKILVYVLKFITVLMYCRKECLYL